MEGFPRQDTELVILGHHRVDSNCRAQNIQNPEAAKRCFQKCIKYFRLHTHFPLFCELLNHEICLTEVRINIKRKCKGDRLDRVRLRTKYPGAYRTAPLHTFRMNLKRRPMILNLLEFNLVRAPANT